MCGGIEVKKPALLFTTSTTDYKANKMVMSPLISIEKDPSSIDEVGLWYVRKKGSKQIVLEHQTSLSAPLYTVWLLVVLLMLLKWLDCFFLWVQIPTLKMLMDIGLLM
ncbi:hypothetical protein Hanom_Chr06g00505501 [Helianthus anomalus]